jgi:hypothetical protein
MFFPLFAMKHVEVPSFIGVPTQMAFGQDSSIIQHQKHVYTFSLGEKVVENSTVQINRLILLASSFSASASRFSR